jgi:hypothetical protein
MKVRRAQVWVRKRPREDRRKALESERKKNSKNQALRFTFGTTAELTQLLRNNGKSDLYCDLWRIAQDIRLPALWAALAELEDRGLDRPDWREKLKRWPYRHDERRAEKLRGLAFHFVVNGCSQTEAADLVAALTGSGPTFEAASHAIGKLLRKSPIPVHQIIRQVPLRYLRIAMPGINVLLRAWKDKLPKLPGIIGQIASADDLSAKELQRRLAESDDPLVARASIRKVQKR